MANNAAVPPLGLQPNFEVLAQSFNAAATEIQRCSNMPAIQQGNDILQVLQRMETGMERMETRMERMETRMERMETRMERLETRVERGFARQEVHARNYRSSLHNSHVGIYDDARLEPLMSLQTHQLIEPFPATLYAIDRMNGTQLDNLLTALEENTGGTVPAKKARVKWAIGIRQRALQGHPE